MKIIRTLVILLLAGLTLYSIAGCGGGAAGSGNLTEEEVLEAFGISFTGYLLAVSDVEDADQGDTINGATLESNGISFADYDLSSVSGTYLSMSGLVSEISNGMSFDFTLSGGVVSTVSYSFSEAQMSATDEVTFTVTANGDDYTITATAPD